MAQQRASVTVKLCGSFAIYLQLLLIGQHLQSTLALFEGCDNKYNLPPDVSFLESPYFPQYYPAYTSCRYNFVALADYIVNIVCDIDMRGDPFYVATDGDVLLRQSYVYTDRRRIQHTTQFNTLTVAYASYGQRGRFNCTLNAYPCDCGWSMNTRITNGKEARINEFPSMVAIKDRESGTQSFCGGSIITSRFVVSAAHCIFFQMDPKRLVILAGDHNLRSNTETPFAASYNVLQVIPHSEYDENTNANDIGLYKTTIDIVFSRGVAPICLPYINNDFVNQSVVLAGWGTDSFSGAPYSSLQKIVQTVLRNDYCSAEYRNLAVVYAEQICTYDSTGRSMDTCQNDSGGPVIWQGLRQFLIGIISFGRGCGYSSFPVGINTRLTSNLAWIRNQTGSTTCRKAVQ